MYQRKKIEPKTHEMPWLKRLYNIVLLKAHTYDHKHTTSYQLPSISPCERRKLSLLSYWALIFCSEGSPLITGVAFICGYSESRMSRWHATSLSMRATCAQLWKPLLYVAFWQSPYTLYYFIIHHWSYTFLMLLKRRWSSERVDTTISLRCFTACST